TAGTLPLTWSILPGSLPLGLAISSGGVISGTPALTGTYSIPVTVIDGSVPAQTATKTITLTIIPTTLLVTTSSPLPTGVVGVFYVHTLAAAGPSPQNWSVISGVAPPGTSVTSS